MSRQKKPKRAAHLSLHSVTSEFHLQRLIQEVFQVGQGLIEQRDSDVDLPLLQKGRSLVHRYADHFIVALKQSPSGEQALSDAVFMLEGLLLISSRVQIRDMADAIGRVQSEADRVRHESTQVARAGKDPIVARRHALLTQLLWEPPLKQSGKLDRNRLLSALNAGLRESNLSPIKIGTLNSDLRKVSVISGSTDQTGK